MNKLAFTCLLTLMGCYAFCGNSVPENLRESLPLPDVVEMADTLFDSEDYKSALKFYEESLSLVLDKSTKATVITKIARCHHKLADYASALEYFYRFLEMPASYSSSSDRAKVLGYIASIYQKIGNFQQSYSYQLEALGIMESKKDSIGMARSLYKLGTLFFYQRNLEKALEYYLRSREICQALEGQERSMFACLGAIGSVYSEQKRMDEALEYHFEALAIAKKRVMKTGEAYTLHNIGASYLTLLDFDRALSYLTNSLLIKKELGDQWGQIGSYETLGQLFIETGEVDRAIEQLEIGLRMAKELGSKTREMELIELLSMAYRKLGNNGLAYDLLSDHLSLKDSLFNEQTIQEMGNRKREYEINKRENEIKLLKKENLILEHSTEIKILTNRYLMILLAFSALLFIALLLLYRFVSQRKWTKQLKEKNRKIHLQNQRLEISNQELKKFAFIASHDLKAPVRTIGSFTSLLKRRYKGVFDETAREYMDFIVAGTQRMYRLLDDLLAYSNLDSLADQSPEETARLQKWVDTKEIVHMAISNLTYSIDENDAEVLVDEDALPRIKANPTQLVQVFQNIIGNGIKFNDRRRPSIRVDCMASAEQYVFSVTDNGIGVEEEFKGKIFDMFSRLHAVGAYEGSGIGLATCKRIINRMGGKIWVESEAGKGSTFFFSIPKH